MSVRDTFTSFTKNPLGRSVPTKGSTPLYLTFTCLRAFFISASSWASCRSPVPLFSSPRTWRCRGWRRQAGVVFWWTRCGEKQTLGCGSILFMNRNTERYQLYRDYLESDHWRLLRAQAIRRAGGKCEVCSSTKHLVGHHLLYRQRMEMGVLDDIMCMCRKCHDLWHDLLKAWNKRPEHYNRLETIWELQRPTYVKPIKLRKATWQELVAEVNPEKGLPPPELYESLPEWVKNMAKEFMTLAPRCGSKGQRNWAIKQTIAALKARGLFTPLLGKQLRASKSGAKGRRWREKLKKR
jgi:hypothetical protein